MKKENSFFEKVYYIVKHIPYGKVTTYGEIAKYLGSSKSARVVGWALNSNKGNFKIPAHRVVNKNGLLTGKFHFEGVNLMEDLLKSEGVIIENHKILNFKEVFWKICIKN